MDAKIQAAVDLWNAQVKEGDLKSELTTLLAPENADKLYDAFYRDLAFGTAGLRGVLGVGTNRMNVYVVAQATQGVADYLNAHYEQPSLALARDSRNKGEDFQRVAAGVLAANGIKVYVYPRIEPVPTLSFAVRYLHTSAGIVLTASHNPAVYNGYKVYNDNGGQITDEAAAEISANIARVNPFDVKIMDFDEGLAQGLIEWTSEEVLDNFIAAIKRVSVPGFTAADGYKVVSTPISQRAPIQIRSFVRLWSLRFVLPIRSSPICWLQPIPMRTVWVRQFHMMAITCCSPAMRWGCFFSIGCFQWQKSAARSSMRK